MAAREYEMALHFSRRNAFVMEPTTKARSFALVPGKDLDILMTFHSNKAVHYML